jgi:hypothetical protein
LVFYLFTFIETNHLFDEIQITLNKDFALKHKIFDDNPMSEKLPQFYLIETGNNNEKSIFSPSYFRFSDDMNKYFQGKGKEWKSQPTIDNITYVTELNSQNFEEKFLLDTSFEESLIEVKHQGCPTCYMLGKMVDLMSHKFAKHKLDKKFKFFLNVKFFILSN